jgi:SAM-dependent methyltransferase
MQEGMLSVLRRRAAKAGLGDRIITHLCAPDSLRLEEFAERIDFALAFAVVHEVPDSRKLFQEISAALKPHARLLVAEPKGHVSDNHFAETVSIARQHGFQVAGEPRISRSHAVLLQKQ